MKRSLLAPFPASGLFPPRMRVQLRTGSSCGAERRMAFTSPSGSGWGLSKNRNAAREPLLPRDLVAAWAREVQGSVRGYLQFKQQQIFEMMWVHPKTKIMPLLFSECTAIFRQYQQSLWVTLDQSYSLLFRKTCCLPVLEPAVCVVLEVKNEWYTKFFLFKKKVCVGVGRTVII